MSNIDFIRRFYSLPRITAEDRVELIGMFHKDVEYHGVDKERAHGRDAIERLFTKYEAQGRGVTDVKFEINHIAETGNTVLVDMVDSFVVNGRPFSGVWSHVFKIENDQIIFWQEHYPVERMEAMFADPIPVTESGLGSAD